MKILLLLLSIAALVVAVPRDATQTSKPPAGPTRKARPANAQSSFTGCVDQRESHYFLTEETEMEPVARLRASGATEDNWFAKHVGHRVRITGQATEEKGTRIIQVRRIDTLSDTCESR